MALKVKQAIKRLEKGGWIMVRIRGDHRTFKKDGVVHLITVAGNLNDDLSIGQEQDIKRKAGCR